MAAAIHVGDIGTSLRATVYDQGGVIVDLSSFDALTIKLLKPDHTTVEFITSLFTDGTDGVMEYVTTLASDLDIAGIWKLQGIVELGGGTAHHSDIIVFRVEGNLC